MEIAIQNALTEGIIRESARLYDTPFDTIKKIGGFENFVYEYEKKGENYILRFVHSSHRSKEQVFAELEFIDFLDKNNARVSTVIHSENDNLLEVIKINQDDYFIISVFVKAPGEKIKLIDLTNEFYEMFGEEVGKLHKLTKKYKPIHKRIDWDEELLLEKSRKLLGKNDRILVEKYEKLVKKVQKLPKNIDNFGLIHTDLHFGNMHLYGGELMFFDWDDAAYKHFISDIAIVIFYRFMNSKLSGDALDKEIALMLAPFFKGYLKQNSIDISFLSNLNDFLMLRTIVLYVVIHMAGEELVDSPWGKQYIEKYRERIINETPYLTLEKVTEFL
ncbi:serine/threonine protein kinase [Candidatus Izimaplasma bacterium HR1]|jgi:Ser/Thr protein kinase RdoA (MazF antagonist)|uniref:phosphotransferase enzyme family protein n=1 Tax=Candidatus Izimoplasma sp. HR1 TaxID=1541959 RepID=UPI0004F770C0|nr:serine/threonine protein kinase [Candidatus Izimaplasma bacterium HR1]